MGNRSPSSLPIAYGPRPLSRHETVTPLPPGIHRIASELGPRPFAQYLLRGDRTMLVDTGIATTPADVILPWLAERGIDPAEIDDVLISHADVDHFGGNSALRAAAPRARFLAHACDVAWVESKERILAERYGWYAAHGPEADYDADTKAFLPTGIGDDIPVDIHLQGGERFRIGPELTVEVLHLPGHTDGHVGLWDPASRTAIVIDAVLGSGLTDFAGDILQPPPYFDAEVYEATVAELRALAPARLLTAHYPVMEGDAVEDFLDRSAAFVPLARAAVAEALQRRGTATLGQLLSDLNPVLGPFTSFANELGGPIRAHLRELVEVGRATYGRDAVPPTWTWMS